jgi:ribonuclease P protein component
VRAWSSLTSAKDFSATLSSGRRYRAEGLTVTVSRSAESGPPRLGLAVKASSAVERNRVKRRLRAAADRVEMTPGSMAVITAGHAASAIPFQNLVESLDRALREAV